MQCDWEELGPGNYHCRRCGWQSATPIEKECKPLGSPLVRPAAPVLLKTVLRPPPARRQKQIPRKGCIRLGDELRQEVCQSCSGTTRIKVFRCAKHGQCTLLKALPGIKTCDGCPDYRTAPYSLADITIIVSSFLRFDCLRRFLTSVRYYYPGLPVIVAEQSGKTASGNADAEFCRAMPGVTWLDLPYDCGLSAARNAAVRAAKTGLVFVADDDEVFSEETRLESLLDVLNSEPEIGLVAGLIRQGSRGHKGDTAGGWQADLSLNEGVLAASPLASPWQQTPAGTWYRRTDRYINVFLASRQLLLDHPWSEKHKISGEHLDHVLRLKTAGVKVAYTPECIIGEAPSANYDYLAFRRRGKEASCHADFAVRERTGEWRFQPEPGIRKRASESPTAEPPCIVLLTVGHTGSTVVAGLFGVLGWHLPDNDPEYNEPRATREANVAILRGENVDCQRLIAGLPRPWLIKDPRLSLTLEHWLPALAGIKPMLVWLERDEAAVRASWQRRGEPLELLAKRQQSAETAFEYWPWAKQRIDFESVGRWISRFKGEVEVVRLS